MSIVTQKEKEQLELTQARLKRAYALYQEAMEKVRIATAIAKEELTRTLTRDEIEERDEHGM